MPKIRVAYILFRFPSLTETFIAEEIQKIQKEDVEVKVYSLLPPKEDLIHPVSQSLLPLTRNVPRLVNPAIGFAQIFFLIKKPRLYFHLLRTLLMQPANAFSTNLQRIVIFLKSVWVAKDLQISQIQLIHTHFAWLSAAASWVVGQLLDLPFTVTTHAFDIYSERNDLLQLITNQASKVITISDHNKNSIQAKNPVLQNGKLQVIRCGIDLSYFSSPAAEQFPTSSPVQITSIGSLIEKKGHEYLIKACNILKNQDFPFQCMIIGAGSQHAFLENMIRENNLSEYVVLAGKKSQDWVRDRLSRSHLFVLACVRTDDNDQDGIPVAMMEAMAMGIPVISTAVSGIPEIIINEETGLIVDERDPEFLCKAIIRLSSDASLRKALGEKGLMLIQQEYDIRKNVKQLRTIFSEVVNVNPQPNAKFITCENKYDTH